MKILSLVIILLLISSCDKFNEPNYPRNCGYYPKYKKVNCI